MQVSFLQEYLKLREAIDKKCSLLWKQHKKDMACSKGCSSCCQEFKLLPVEFFAIEQLLKHRKVETNPSVAAGACRFLINKSCSIYEHRPMICRTHGFPIARYNEEEEAFEISYCPLNFKQVALNSFNQRNVYLEEKYNEQLFRLNLKFLRNKFNNSSQTMALILLNKLQVNPV